MRHACNKKERVETQEKYLFERCLQHKEMCLS